MTLAGMGEVARRGFAQVQRPSTKCHADSFAGSTARVTSRGMRALDRISVSDQGRVVEDGAHAARVRRPDGDRRALSERQAVLVDRA